MIGLAALAACGSYGGATGGGAGDFGATQGGVQDMSLAREAVENGRVPAPEALLVEGMFSEHDLPLEGAACETLLCLRGALGVAPDASGEPAGWMQVGMSSTIEPETYERPSVTIVATVDVSGSMHWGYEEDPTPGEVSRAMLHRIADELDAQDRIAIVTYGSDVNKRLGPTPGDQHGTIERKIDDLSGGGSTNMEAGLRKAYDIGRDARGQTDEVRVMLFTDVRPNVGATDASEFERMTAAGAGDGIGLTLMSAGLGLDPKLAKSMSHLRGGNAFSLFDFEDVDETMEGDWPWMVSPIAYDLRIELEASSGFGVVEGYGFPTGEAEGQASMEVSTVFLSERKGALLLQLAPLGDTAMSELAVSGRLSYTTPAGEPVEQSLELQVPAESVPAEGSWFEQPGVEKTTALALLVSGMREAAELYGSDRDAAVETMRAAYERFEADAEAIDDPAIGEEVGFAGQMLELMQSGASQETFYGGR
ncbi:MAG: vWA domain-containing protein [Polyangiales bacterium]